jgi:hypothetical protein
VAGVAEAVHGAVEADGTDGRQVELGVGAGQEREVLEREDRRGEGDASLLAVLGSGQRDVVDGVGPPAFQGQRVGARAVDVDRPEEGDLHRVGRSRRGPEDRRARRLDRARHGVHERDVVERGERPQPPVGDGLGDVDVVADRGGQAAPQPELLQIGARERRRQPEPLLITRGHGDREGAPVEAPGELGRAAQVQSERLALGPGAAVGGGEALDAEGVADRAVAPGVLEDQRDPPGGDVGEVREPQLVCAVHDVLAGRRRIPEGQRERLRLDRRHRGVLGQAHQRLVEQHRRIRQARHGQVEERAGLAQGDGRGGAVHGGVR